jgi:hypothetical protein
LWGVSVLPCCFFSSALAEFYTVFERGVVSSILAQKVSHNASEISNSTKLVTNVSDS